MKKRVAIIGDSTCEWIRPYRNDIDELTYTELLMQDENNLTVDIYIRPGMTSHEALVLVWKELMGKFYDYYIFSFGINDCTPRSYPKLLADYYNKTLIPNGFLHKVYFFIYRVFTSTKVQKVCSKLNISRPWVALPYFENNIDKIIEILNKETDSKLIFLALPQTSQRVSSILYNINNLILEYNKIFKVKESEDILIVDLDTLFKKDYNLYIPEGIHYSAEGHQSIYHKILSWINRDV